MKRARLAKGLTQEQFAEVSGFTQQYLSGLERGRRNPTIVTLFELSQALGVEHVALVTPDSEAQSERKPNARSEAKVAASPRANIGTVGKRLAGKSVKVK